MNIIEKRNAITKFILISMCILFFLIYLLFSQSNQYYVNITSILFLLLLILLVPSLFAMFFSSITFFLIFFVNRTYWIGMVFFDGACAFFSEPNAKIIVYSVQLFLLLCFLCCFIYIIISYQSLYNRDSRTIIGTIIVRFIRICILVGIYLLVTSLSSNAAWTCA